ncbi:MAG: PAS domain S-box protein, partial [Syntrophales bacterium LBB04]|nr:PAS domain S-box protein [Syntrophales bacterium LBB04]
MHGYTVDEPLDMNIRDLDTAEVAQESPARFARLLQGEWIKAEISHRRKNGTIIPIELSAGMFTLGEHRYVLAFDRDITERKRVEDELLRHREHMEDLIAERTSELALKNLELRVEIDERRRTVDELRKLTRAVEQSPAMTVITDREGTIQYVNPRFSEITGYSAKEALNKNPRILKSGVHPPEFYVEMYDVLLQGNIWRGEICNRKKNGELYWESASIAPIKNSRGVTTHYVAIKEDITERKQMETALLLAKEAAEDASRAKSDFLANMPHERGTPLNAIIGFSDLMIHGMAGELTDKQKEYLNDVKESGDLLLSLINDILDLSKVEAGRVELELEKVDVQNLIERSMMLVTEKALNHDITLVSEIPPDIGIIDGDGRRLKQVIVNLLSNAVKFTPDGGSVSVKARKVQSSKFKVQGSGEVVLEPNKDTEAVEDFVEISVIDTGIGIAPENQQKLFRPFHRVETSLTKKYVGTGL